MLSLIVYMIIGAVMLYVFGGSGSKKLETQLPDWYKEYVEEYKDSKYGYMERETFDKAVKYVIVLWFVLGWPTILFMFLAKIFKDKK